MNEPLNRKLQIALVGGAETGFIGRVHAAAAVRDLWAELVAAALSSDTVKARHAAAEFGLAPARAYTSFEQLLESESRLAEDQRIDFVSIATPNHLHYPMAKAAIEADIHVICDKPMTIAVSDAEHLVRIAEKLPRPVRVGHIRLGCL